MRCSCAMMSPSVISPIEDEGADVDRVERDGAEREGKVAESDCLDRNCHLTTFYGSGADGTHESEMVGQGKRNRKVA